MHLLLFILSPKELIYTFCVHQMLMGMNRLIQFAVLLFTRRRKKYTLEGVLFFPSQMIAISIQCSLHEADNQTPEAILIENSVTNHILDSIHCRHLIELSLVE